MPYKSPYLEASSSQIKVTNIYRKGSWRWLGLFRLCFRLLRNYFWLCMIAASIAYGLWPYLLGYWIVKTVARQSPKVKKILTTMWDRIATRDNKLPMRVFLKINKYWPTWSWQLYHTFASADAFGQDYRHAWREELGRRPDAVVLDLDTFVGGQMTRLPLLYNAEKSGVGDDRETIEMLRMWYCWMQVKRGFGEWLLPRNLLRIDKIELFHSGREYSLVGKRIATLELGRTETTYVAAFDNPSGVSDKETEQTKDMLEDPMHIGIEFVRNFDVAAVSAVSLAPFALSLLFIALWIGIFIGKEHGDPQTVSGTAFTGASYIITTGAFLIALFAFLDSQAVQID